MILVKLFVVQSHHLPTLSAPTIQPPSRKVFNNENYTLISQDTLSHSHFDHLGEYLVGAAAPIKIASAGLITTELRLVNQNPVQECKRNSPLLMSTWQGTALNIVQVDVFRRGTQTLTTHHSLQVQCLKRTRRTNSAHTSATRGHILVLCLQIIPVLLITRITSPDGIHFQVPLTAISKVHGNGKEACNGIRKLRTPAVISMTMCHSPLLRSQSPRHRRLCNTQNYLVSKDVSNMYMACI
jgi:hypothetical protein